MNNFLKYFAHIYQYSFTKNAYQLNPNVLISPAETFKQTVLKHLDEIAVVLLKILM